MEMAGLQRRAAAAVVSVATVATMTVAVAPTASAADAWGSVAYSHKLDKNGKTQMGGVVDAPSKASAESGALSACGQSDCEVLLDFNDCAAVAFDGENLYGAHASTLKAAEQAALKKLGSKAVIDSEGCNSGYS